MNKLGWYSTKIRMTCLVQTIGAHRNMDSVFIFQSTDFDKAFEKTIELGKSKEQSYLNSDKQLVVWKFRSVISLDFLGYELNSGIEIYSEPVELKHNESISFDTQFHPEDSQPTQTI